MQKIEIRPYFGAHDREIRALILGIQNGEAGIGLSLREQPDLLDIRRAYQEPGGEFRLALSGGRAIGTIGLRMEPQHCAILKKFFVDAAHRSQGVGGALCRELPAFAMAAPGWSTSFWIPLRRPMPRTVSMSGPDSAPSPGRRFPFRIPTPTGTASSISQTCELPLPPRPPGQGPGRRTAGRAGREGRGLFPPAFRADEEHALSLDRHITLHRLVKREPPYGDFVPWYDQYGRRCPGDAGWFSPEEILADLLGLPSIAFWKKYRGF